MAASVSCIKGPGQAMPVQLRSTGSIGTVEAAAAAAAVESTDCSPSLSQLRAQCPRVAGYPKMFEPTLFLDGFH